MPPENEQAITDNDIGDAELQQWLTSIGDGADIELPGLSLGGPFTPPAPPAPTGEEPTGEEDDDDDDPEADETLDPDPTGAPATQAGADDDFEVNGQRISRADVERLHNFDQWMRANPDAAQRVNAAIAEPTTPTPDGGQPPVSSTPEPTGQVAGYEAPEPPDFLDLDDPAQKFQWDTHVATQKVLFDQAQAQQRFFASQAETQRQVQTRQAETDMATALTVFKTAHPNLNDDDIVAIRKAAGPFVSGMLAQLPPVEALTRSMEVGGMMDETLRAKLIDPEFRTRSAKEQTRHRKRISGQISGSPRSAPKGETTRPAYQSDKDFLNSLAEGFREQMQG